MKMIVDLREMAFLTSTHDCKDIEYLASGMAFFIVLYGIFAGDRNILYFFVLII